MCSLQSFDGSPYYVDVDVETKVEIYKFGDVESTQRNYCETNFLRQLIEYLQ
jgi:hypothetical protein